jgi:DNA (cytosine-5)-methyltransferase 1
MKSNTKPRVISLFSGAGGLDLGFIQAGFDIVYAIDFFKEAVDTYKKNIGDHIEFNDITKVRSSDMPDDIDVVIGGFPCQGFSIANTKRSTEDKRNFLYKEMLRVIEDKSPKVFLAENVKGILSIGKGEVIKLIKEDFRNLGYEVKVKLLNSAEYGVPQARERVIIIGSKNGINVSYPKISHYIDETLMNFNLQKAKTVEDTIKDLYDVHISYEPISLNGKVIYNHIARDNVSDKFWGRKYEVNQHDICDYLKAYRNKSNWTTKKIDEHFGYRHTAGHWFRKDNNSGSIPNPNDWREIKKILKFDDKYDKVVTTYIEKEIKFEQSLRISNWNRPSDTITATGPEIHPNKWRRLSVRECARLQTFPDDFVFEGSISRMYRQIGNAVPVKLAKELANEIHKALEKD